MSACVPTVARRRRPAWSGVEVAARSMAARSWPWAHPTEWRYGSIMGQEFLRGATSAVQLPAYDRSKITVGIVHFGVGGFHRAHQALGDRPTPRAGRGGRVGHLRGRSAARRSGDAARTGGSGLPVHAGGEGRRRQPHGPGDRGHRRVSLRPGRSRGRPGAARRSGHPHRLADGDRRRLPDLPGDRGVRVDGPTGCGRPGARRRAGNGVRNGGRGASPPPGAWCAALHRDVVRQHLGQRVCGSSGVLRVRRGEGSRPRGVDADRGRVPQLHGRPDHAGDHRCGSGRDRRGVRDHRRLAGGRRAVLPVGAGGLLRRRTSTASTPVASNSWRT